MIYRFENAVSQRMTEFLFYEATTSNRWSFTYPLNTPIDESFPKLDVIMDDGIREPYLAGIALSLLLNIYERIGEDYFFPEVHYCGISIKDKHRLDNIHTDDCDLKVLTLLNQEWKPEWGGEFIFDGEAYPLTPGDVIVFNPRIPHGAAPINIDKKRIALDMGVKPPRGKNNGN